MRYVVTLWALIKGLSAAGLGLALLAGGPASFEQSRSFRVSALLLPWWLWGGGFVLGGAGLVFASLRHHPTTALVASLIPALLFGTFATSLGIASYQAGGTLPWTGVAIYTAMSISTVVAGALCRLVFASEATWFGNLR